jgi:hypothetical protein
MGQMLLIPYLFVLDLVKLWWEIMTTHFTIGLLIPHLIGLFIVSCWISIERSCRIIRDPSTSTTQLNF